MFRGRMTQEEYEEMEADRLDHERWLEERWEANVRQVQRALEALEIGEAAVFEHMDRRVRRSAIKVERLPETFRVGKATYGAVVRKIACEVVRLGGRAAS